MRPLVGMLLWGLRWIGLTCLVGLWLATAGAVGVGFVYESDHFFRLGATVGMCTLGFQMTAGYWPMTWVERLLDYVWPLQKP